MEKLTLRIEKVLIFLIIIIFFISLFFLSVRNLITHKGDLIVILFFLAILLIPFILSVTYFYHDLSKQVFVDKNNRELLINRHGEKSIIRQDDIVESYIVKVDPNKYGHKRIKFPYYKYIALILKERKKIYITCLLCEPELIIEALNLNCKMEYYDIPFIYSYLGNNVLTTKGYNDRVIEFENNFKDYSNSKLAEIIENKSDYTDYAKEAATILLKKRRAL